MKDQLIFDTTDANTIADSDSVGAYVRSSDGTLITHTTVGGKEALDVRLAEGVNVEVDLDHADDSVRLGDGTTLHTGTTVGSDHGLDVYNINNPATSDTAIATAAETLDVASTAQNAVVSALANRKVLYIYNNDNRQLEIGTAGFSIGDGFPLSPGAFIKLDAGPSIDVEFNSPKINHEIRTLEMS